MTFIVWAQSISNRLFNSEFGICQSKKIPEAISGTLLFCDVHRSGLSYYRHFNLAGISHLGLDFL